MSITATLHYRCSGCDAAEDVEVGRLSSRFHCITGHEHGFGHWENEVIADPPEEQNGLILPEGAKGPAAGIVVRVSDEVEDFTGGGKVFYRGPTIDIDRQTIGVGAEDSVKRETTKLISVEQTVAVEEGE